MPIALTRTRKLTACAVLVTALLAVAAFAPLPISVIYPGLTANVLGSYKGTEVIRISGAKARPTTGQLRMTTITATGPDATVRLADVVKAWFAPDEAAMPRDAVYPTGGTTQEIEKFNLSEMRKSQDAATTVALDHLHLSPSDVKVTLSLADVGGPSAGLMFSLGIIDKLDGTELTGGRVIAGTGTITASGTVGAVGGVPLKMRAAKRDKATVFLVPRDECSDAVPERPAGLRLIPVSNINGALSALTALRTGGKVPSC
jgi:PDZ domain-containing protein